MSQSDSTSIESDLDSSHTHSLESQKNNDLDGKKPKNMKKTSKEQSKNEKENLIKSKTTQKKKGKRKNNIIEPTFKCYFMIMSFFTKKFGLVLTLVFALACGIVQILLNLALGQVTEVLVSGNVDKSSFNKEMLKFTIVTIAFMVATAGCFGSRGFANPECRHDLLRALHRQILNQDISFFDETPTGILISRLSEDTALVYGVYVEKVQMAVQDIVSIFGGIILALITVWRVTLLAIAILVVCMIIFWVSTKVVNKYFDILNEKSSIATSKAEEVITSFGTVKSFDNELYELRSYKSKLKDVNNMIRKTSLVKGISDGIILALINIMIAGVMILASYLIIKKPEMGYTSGDLMFLLISLVLTEYGIALLLSLTDDFKKANMAASRLLSILYLEPEVDQENDGKSLKEKYLTGKIEFRNVGFRYKAKKKSDTFEENSNQSDKKDEWALRNLSFTIQPGQTVAFVGESGCGKTTTLQLLQRFYEIEEGQILIDDIDIKSLNPQYVRTSIASVPQTPVLFTMSILDNIRYCNPDKSEEEVADAARLGNAHNFIMEMPENYSSLVQQSSLSGGQKQRICISRAILSNVPILLLDEATAALDTESEQLVQQSLEQFRKDKTVIIVAHRLATVKHADRILVFKGGHIVEEGTHDSLMEKNGVYSDLVKHQLH
ncbi:ABC transporter family protein [Tritrichomonas foetus]|uniref:ABC transporter family protein n=1 Tax=Tritrichomonas foetus TaxID=1144522 RepID=A0A1J4KJW2_9EUKA|nr:ABC transporter family protein [Tritrichomonas foetus]|eukprot:OHT11402.1 ABC transporter family protein [Tritrichomonas foetus]